MGGQKSLKIANVICERPLAHKRKVFVKQTLHWFLCKRNQLLFIQVVFNLILNLPYNVPHSNFIHEHFNVKMILKIISKSSFLKFDLPSFRTLTKHPLTEIDRYKCTHCIHANDDPVVLHC